MRALKTQICDESMQAMFIFLGVAVLALALSALAQQWGRRTAVAKPGEEVEGVIRRDGDERYRLTFTASGTAFVEVTGAPADCAFQVGSQGFLESDFAPVDWTDGEPGQSVAHSFPVRAGRPGTVWVSLRLRSRPVQPPIPFRLLAHCVAAEPVCGAWPDSSAVVVLGQSSAPSQSA